VYGLIVEDQEVVSSTNKRNRRWTLSTWLRYQRSRLGGQWTRKTDLQVGLRD